MTEPAHDPDCIDLTMRGPSADHCPDSPGDPDDGPTHNISYHKPAHTQLSIARCSWCGWIDGPDLERQIDEQLAEAHAEVERLKTDRLISVIFSHTKGAPRPFALHRREDVTGVSGTGVVAVGAEFPDGLVVLRWTSAFPTSVVFHERGIESVQAIHGHDGRTQIVWLSEELEPLAAMETERDALRAELHLARDERANVCTAIEEALWPDQRGADGCSLADAIRHVRQLAELRAIFDLGWSRMGEAEALWRAEDPDERALVAPDLGRLLEWLMQRYDKVAAELDHTKWAMRDELASYKATVEVLEACLDDPDYPAMWHALTKPPHAEDLVDAPRPGGGKHTTEEPTDANTVNYQTVRHLADCSLVTTHHLTCSCGAFAAVSNGQGNTWNDQVEARRAATTPDDLHARLTAAIQHRLDLARAAAWPGSGSWHRVISLCEGGLRIVGRHKPFPDTASPTVRGCCEHCGPYGYMETHNEWPCPDIRDLAAMFGVEVTG